MIGVGVDMIGVIVVDGVGVSVVVRAALVNALIEPARATDDRRIEVYSTVGVIGVIGVGVAMIRVIVVGSVGVIGVIGLDVQIASVAGLRTFVDPEDEALVLILVDIVKVVSLDPYRSHLRARWRRRDERPCKTPLDGLLIEPMKIDSVDPGRARNRRRQLSSQPSARDCLDLDQEVRSTENRLNPNTRR